MTMLDGVRVLELGTTITAPLAAVMLVGLGIRELSMEAAAIPEIKEALRRVTTVDCERTAESALKLDTADAVEELIAGTFAPVLFDLLESDEDSYETEPTEHAASAPPHPEASAGGTPTSD